MDNTKTTQKGYLFVLVEVIDDKISRITNFSTRQEADSAMAEAYDRMLMSVEAQNGFDGAADGEIDHVAGTAWVKDLDEGTRFSWNIEEASRKDDDVPESKDMPAADTENVPAANADADVEIENDQVMLNNLLKAIQCTRSFGKVREDSNYILELKLIQKEDGWTDMWGRPHAGGKYVRIVWSDNPERSDGYYDINVEATSTWGIITTVIDYLKKH